MDVKEFVKTTLLQVHSGLREANDNDEEFKIFGSSNHHVLENTLPGIMQDHLGQLYTSVDFDIAVTVTKEGGGGAKLSIPFVEVGGKAQLGSETVSRVKFSVPLRF